MTTSVPVRIRVAIPDESWASALSNALNQGGYPSYHEPFEGRWAVYVKDPRMARDAGAFCEGFLAGLEPIEYH